MNLNRPLYFLTCIFCILFSIKSFAQPINNYTSYIRKIDSLSDMGLPKSALAEVDQLEEYARRNNHPAYQVKATIYRILFHSYLEENALEKVIIQLKSDIEKSKYPVKQVLQSLLADVYWKYYQENRFLFYGRTSLEKPGADFTRWDLSTLANEVSRLYRLSLKDFNKEQSTLADTLKEVLTGNDSTRYLRPTLYDLLAHRALNFFLSEEPNLPKPKLPFNLNDKVMFANSADFAEAPIHTSDTTSISYQGIKLLQQLTLFHLKSNNKDALTDVDLKRLKYVRRSGLYEKDSLFISGLKQVINTREISDITGDAYVLLGRYYKERDSLITAQFYLNKATKLLPKGLAANNARALLEEIGQKEIKVSIENVNIPGKPILALANYRNLSKIHYTLYKPTQQQFQELYKLSTDEQFWPNNNEIRPRPNVKKYLLNLKPVLEDSVQLPGPVDLKTHSAEFMINPLPAGDYLLLCRDANSDENYLWNFTEFKVSNLSYFIRKNPKGDIDIIVLNRETGAPLAGVGVRVKESHYEKNEIKQVLIGSGISDKNGLFSIDSLGTNSYQIAVSLFTRADSLIGKYQYIDGVISTKPEIEQEKEEERTILFTDRRIYRPGQTIYFKALQVIGKGKKTRIVANKEIEVGLYDANWKQAGELTLVTNEFGTISGSFVIPQNTLNGKYTLDTDDGRINVQVEEYKRPSFQIEFEPFKKLYKLNDSITLKGIVRAFAGYGLSKVRVVYRVTKSNYSYGSIQTELKSDTIFTGANGEFAVSFKAHAGENALKGNWPSCYYQISADVTDAAGETHSKVKSLVASTMALQLYKWLPSMVFARDSIKIPVSISNNDNWLQDGEVRVKVYSLKTPLTASINRLWTAPDTKNFTEEKFNKLFPYLRFDDRMREVENCDKGDLIKELSVRVLASKKNYIDLSFMKELNTGYYKIEYVASHANGDTVSAENFTYLSSAPAFQPHGENWVIPVKTSIKEGEKAEFLVGLGSQCKVLIETYNGDQVLSKKWLQIGNKQEPAKVDFPQNCTQCKVQFLMVFQNRLFHRYYSISKIKEKEEDKLDIRFLSFRDKLEPGAKEQWKLQISSKKMQAAEMLATLYDASLDDISGRGSWNRWFKSGDNSHSFDYYQWSYGSITAEAGSQAFGYFRSYLSMKSREYEQLALMGYEYYGGHNNAYPNYQRRVQQRLKIEEQDKKLKQEYIKNSALIKDGYIVSGIVTDNAATNKLTGVSIKIKGTSICTYTNSEGFFKIKVPYHATLMFSYLGYKSFSFKTNKGGTINIKMKGTGMLKDVVVRGYQAKTRELSAGSSVTISGKDLQDIPVQNTEQLLQGKVAGLHVAKAALKPVTIRSNFNETAFFYPQLRTNEKGEILIEFTIPESLTKWHFKGFAHTKDLQTGFIEKELVTQKSLMVSANMPRFFRQEDTISVSAKLANLTDKKLKGKVKLQLYNALNMQPVSLLTDNNQAEQDFELAASDNKGVDFKLAIPKWIDAVTYRIIAEAGQFSDGEENTIPVLPNSMLVTESMPMMVRPGQTKSYTFKKLVTNQSPTLKNKALTFEYTQNSVWYAVQALPYLIEYPYECSEQTFSRYFANTLAGNIIVANPRIKTVFEQWKAVNSGQLLSNLEKNQDLKNVLLEETPWLREASSESERKKRIALLFDLNKLTNEQEGTLKKLAQMQRPDGGFPWFNGSRFTDRYITQHILAGMGQLSKVPGSKFSLTFNTIRDQALSHIDNQLITEYKQAIYWEKKYKSKSDYISSLTLHAVYARSYFLDKSMPSGLKAALTYFQSKIVTEWKFRDVYEQGLMAIIAQRFKQKEVSKAIIRSLKERAQQSDELGMYWSKNRLGYRWYQSPVETQCLLIELFSEIPGNTNAIEEMKVWLLRNKQTSNWKTTKATALACYSLLHHGNNWLEDNTVSPIKINGDSLAVIKPEIKADAAIGYIKTNWADEQIKPGLGKIEITNTGKSVSWGALHLQYTEKLDKITQAETQLKLERKYFIQKETETGPKLSEIDKNHSPKTGDILKVVVYLNADRDYDYIQLKDMRPSGTEPVDVISGYKYQDGLFYYQVTKDVATNFFISSLQKGKYVFEYNLRVVQPGNYSTGISSIQCLYAPEFNAHSDGGRIILKSPENK